MSKQMNLKNIKEIEIGMEYSKVKVMIIFL